MFFTMMVAGPLVEIASISTQITEAFAGLDRIREIKRMTTEDEDEADRDRCPDLAGEITFYDVSFEYNEGAPVLKRVSFSAPAGSTTALVGSSGSGKSTLISLVMTFNRPLAGRGVADGHHPAPLQLPGYPQQPRPVLEGNLLLLGAHPSSNRR